MHPSRGNGESASCHGRVQRVVDGEAHNFDDWPGLVELLAEMSRGKRGTKDGSAKGEEDEQK
jgi:hypothetical protein